MSPIILLIGSMLGAFYITKINALHKKLFVYIIFMLILECVSRILGQLGNNFIILPVYSFIELLIFTWIFTEHLLNDSRKFYSIVCIIGLLYILTEILWHFIINDLDIKSYQSYSKVVDNFTVILMSLSFFLEKTKKFETSSIEKYRLNVIILIFFTFNLMVFLPFNFLVNANTNFKFYFWLISIISLIIFYSYLTYSIWQNARHNKSLKKPA